jgi:type IV pilus assembly protein PilA
MLARLRKTQEENEGGFTLIELLVVVIIIGILAAIAIPTFLNQRTKGWEAAAKADLRNAATAQESYFTETRALTGGGNGNTYTTSKDNLKTEGFNESGNVVLEIPTGSTTAYTMCAQHSSGGGKFLLSSGSGTTVSLARGAACAAPAAPAS